MVIPSSDASISRTTWNILIIDNDEDDFLIARDMLKEARGRKFEVSWVNSYTAGLEALSSNPYHAVLVDYDLGIHSGIDLIREANQRGCSAPLILYTGRGSYEVDVEAMQAGATLYLTKGETSSLLLERSIRYAIERKHIETTLRTSETKYRNLFENMAEEVHFWQVVFDEAGNIQTWRLVDVNPPTLKSWGRTSLAEIIGKTTDEIFGPGATQHYMPVVQKIMRDGIPVSYVDYFPNLDKYFRFTSVPFGDYFITTGADITSVKQAEKVMQQALAEAEQGRQTLDALMNYIPEGITIADGKDVTIRMVSRYGQEMLGGAHDQKTAEQVADEWKIFDRDGATPLPTEQLPLVRAIQRGEVVRNQDLVQVNAAGKRLYLSCNAGPIRDAAGNVTGGVVAWRDISERKETERALQESEERLRDFLESTHDSFFVLDRDWRIQYANRRFAEIMVTGTQELIGKVFWEAFPGYLGTPIEQQYRKVMAERTPTHLEIGGIYSSAWYAVSIYPTQDGLSVFAVDQTERKKAQEALQAAYARLQQSERRLATALDIAQLGVWEFDIAAAVTHIDPRCRDIFGLSDENPLSNAEILALVHPADRPRVAEQVRQALEPGGTGRYETEYRIVRHDSTERWVAIRGHAIRADESSRGEVLQFVGTLMDITEHRQAEAALRESETQLRESQERLERAQKIAHLGSWELDLVYNRLTWSDEVYRIFGLQPGVPPVESGITYEAFLDHVHPDDRAAVDAAYSGSLRENRNRYEIEHRVVRKSTGEIRFVHEKCEHLRDAAGRLIRSVGMVHDITERKQAEVALREAHEQAAWLARFPDENPDPVVRVSADGRVLYRNMAAAKTPGWLCDVDQLLPDAIQTMIKRAMKKEREDHGESELSDRVYSISIMPFPSEGYANLYARDITERKRAEAALAEMVKKLERSNQELEQFAFVASHDLQEPLRKIKLFGNAIQQKLKEKLDEDNQDNFQRMISASDRMQAMIDDLLELSRVNMQGRPFMQVDLSQVAAEVVSDLEPRILRTRGQVVVETLPGIEADPLQIHQVLQNLIGNGLKFHKPDTPPQVRVSSTVFRSTTGKGDMVSIRVQDNGIGFEEQQFEKILQPFQRLHGRSEFEGTGIGLAIVKKIIDRHHGEITAQSALGEGSTFIVTLPIKQKA